MINAMQFIEIDIEHVSLYDQTPLMVNLFQENRKRSILVGKKHKRKRSRNRNWK